MQGLLEFYKNWGLEISQLLEIYLVFMEMKRYSRRELLAACQTHTAAASVSMFSVQGFLLCGYQEIRRAG
jgi:hypothetical protein